MLADVIAMWQMEKLLQGWSVGRCYFHVADGIATGSIHFNLSSEVLNRTRTFGERFKEHLKASSPIFDHYKTPGHQVSIENFSIVGREEQNLMRAIKEALYIRVNNPSLNRNIGKYHLPHIWDEVLFNTSELKLK